jgi:hypothetical protein
MIFKILFTQYEAHFYIWAEFFMELDVGSIWFGKRTIRQIFQDDI